MTTLRIVYDKCGRPLKYYLDGRRISAAKARRLGRRKPAFPAFCRSRYPFSSVSAGVHPEQVPALREALRKAGIPTEFTPDGDPIYSGPRHRARYLKFMGFIETK